jgi:hypothetical protein
VVKILSRTEKSQKNSGFNRLMASKLGRWHQPGTIAKSRTTEP